jgi:IS5 family transposase
MDQLSFSDAEYGGKRKQTRREKFLAEMEKVVPWDRLEQRIEQHYPKAGNGRHPYPLSTMLRIHFLQQWYSLSDPTAEDALYEITSMRELLSKVVFRHLIQAATWSVSFTSIPSSNLMPVITFAR